VRLLIEGGIVVGQGHPVDCCALALQTLIDHSMRDYLGQHFLDAS